MGRFGGICLALSLVWSAVAPPLSAQPATDEETTRADGPDLPPPLKKLRAFLQERAVDRPRFDPPPVGTLPDKVVAATVDWSEVGRLLGQSPDANRLPPRPDLPFPAGFQSLSLDDAPAVDREEISPILIPVLVPSAENVQSSLRLFGQIDSYAAIAGAGDGVDMRISGARKKLVVPDRETVRQRLEQLRTEKPPLPNFGARYLITRSESSTDLSFSRFGCGYVISLICDDPAGDARCAEDHYIRDLAAAMSLLNPRTARKAREGQLETAPDEPRETKLQIEPPQDAEAVAQKAPQAAETIDRELSAQEVVDETKGADALQDGAGSPFTYLPTGELLPQSGPGFVDTTIYRPDIAFPTEDRAFLNSQVYRYGGYYGSLNGMDGGQCAPENFAYPWQDTFCEKRGRKQDLCPGGGHEGLDIRPATCEKDKHWAIAVEDARVIDLRRHWVTLQTADGTLYNYLHLNMKRLQVILGDEVKRGDRIGLVSNDFFKSDGSSVPTTIHLHFEMYENYTTEEDGEALFTKVNPYTTLVNAYDRRLRGE